MRTLYISDLDGTLLNSRKEITDYSSEIINSCIASGVLFSIATAGCLTDVITVCKNCIYRYLLF